MNPLCHVKNQYQLRARSREAGNGSLRAPSSKLLAPGFFKSHRGAAEKSPVGYVVVIISALIVMLVVVFWLAASNADAESTDLMCRQSNQVKGNVPGSSVTQARPGVLPGLVRFCRPQNIKIIADDWKKCDPKFEREFKIGDKDEAIKRCAAQQLADLMERCWWMSGQGKWEPGSYICFSGEVSLESSFDRLDKQKAIATYRKQLLDSLGPSYGGLATNLSQDLFNLHTYEAISQYYQDKIFTLIEACATNTSDAGQLTDRVLQPSVNADYIISPYLVGEYSADLTKKSELLSNLTAPGVTKADAQRLLKGAVETGKEEALANQIAADKQSAIHAVLFRNVTASKAGCSDIEARVLNSITEIEKYDQKATAVLSAMHSNITKSVAGRPENSRKSADEIKAAVSSVENKTMTVGKDLPSMDPIDWDFIKGVMLSTNMTKNKKATYLDAVPAKNIEFIGGFEIMLNGKFEIGMCDPPGSVGSGLLAQGICDVAKGQRVQVTSAGGGAGGLLRGGSPIPNYCRTAYMALLPPEAQDFCAAILKGATSASGRQSVY